MSNGVKVNKYTKEIKKKMRPNAAKLDKEEEMINREEILVAGGENRKEAIKEIQREKKEEKDIKDKLDADFLTSLESKKRWHESYKSVLANALASLLENLDWVRGWNAYCVPTNGAPITIKGKGFNTRDGLLLIVTTPDGRVFHQGILTTGEPLLDYSALYTIAAQVENQMDFERGLLLDRKEEREEKTDKILNQYGQPIKAD